MGRVAVVDIVSGSTRYLGPSEFDAAKQLIPGTCFAKSPDVTTALSLAREQAARFRHQDTQREDASE